MQPTASPNDDGDDIARNVITDPQDIHTAKWIQRWLPAGPFRDAIEASKYRHCVRESAMWGIATGTVMTLHRMRMQSKSSFAFHIGFASLFVVYTGSYYFCVKKRDYQEKMIGLMMKLNSFEHAMDMPETTPVDENHPFVEPGDSLPQRQYVANLPERKEWQDQLPPQDPKDVFTPFGK